MPLNFSPQPGAHESHLQRRANNPLFPPDRQNVSPDEHRTATELDQRELKSFFESFQKTVQRAVELSPHAESDVILDIKQDLERIKGVDRINDLALNDPELHIRFYPERLQGLR